MSSRTRKQRSFQYLGTEAILALILLAAPAFLESAAASPSLKVEQTLQRQTLDIFDTYGEEQLQLRLTLVVTGLEEGAHNLTVVSPVEIQSDFLNDPLNSEFLEEGVFSTPFPFNATCYYRGNMYIEPDGDYYLDPVNLKLSDASAMPYLVLKPDTLNQLDFLVETTKEIYNATLEFALPEPAGDISISAGPSNNLGCTLVEHTPRSYKCTCPCLPAGETTIRVYLRDPLPSTGSSTFTIKWPDSFTDPFTFILDGSPVPAETEQSVRYSTQLYITCDGVPGCVGYLGEAIYNITIEPTSSLWVRLDPSGREELVGISSSQRIQSLERFEVVWQELRTTGYNITFEGNASVSLYVRSRHKVWQLGNLSNVSQESEYLSRYLEPGSPVNPEMRDKVAELIQGSESIAESAYKLCRWVCTEIQYDNESLEAIARGEAGGNQGAETVFLTGKGVCEGKANLLVKMLRLAGIPARTVSGTGLGSSTLNRTKNHAWCQFYEPGLGWIDADPTSGNFAVLEPRFISALAWDPGAEIASVTTVQHFQELTGGNLAALQNLVNKTKNQQVADLIKEGHYEEALRQLSEEGKSEEPKTLVAFLVGVLLGTVACTAACAVLSHLRKRH